MTVTKTDWDAAKESWEKAALADIYCDPRNTGPEFGPDPKDPEGVLADAFAKHREDAERPLLERIGKLEAENARLRAALRSIEKTGTDYKAGPDENMERTRSFARQALGETQ